MSPSHSSVPEVVLSLVVVRYVLYIQTYDPLHGLNVVNYVPNTLTPKNLKKSDALCLIFIVYIAKPCPMGKICGLSKSICFVQFMSDLPQSLWDQQFGGTNLDPPRQTCNFLNFVHKHSLGL